MGFGTSRREFLRDLGLSAGALPFLLNLPSLGFANQQARKQRLIVMFSPNGIVPKTFWPDEEGDQFTLKESLSPLEPYRDRTLVLKGVCDKVRGDGDNHMRGIGCLLTGIELFPGNIQGGSDTPAGWSSGLSIDQEIRKHLQQHAETRTRFGSLEFGVMVPDRADTWTRMVYSGANKPIRRRRRPRRWSPPRRRWRSCGCASRRTSSSRSGRSCQRRCARSCRATARRSRRPTNRQNASSCRPTSRTSSARTSARSSRRGASGSLARPCAPSSSSSLSW